MSTIESGMQPAAAPISESSRVESMDVLRGFALLGILVPNIVFFAWPQSAAMDASFMGESAANELGHRVTGMFFLGKMMMLFAMLFGGGVIFFARRYDRGTPLPKLSVGARRWYTRLAWLLLFGLIHAYGFWYGDILVWYALVGATLVWWVRRWKPINLFIAGGVAYAIGAAIMVGVILMLLWALSAGHVGEDAISADPTAEITAYRGSYVDAFRIRFFTALIMHIFMLPLFFPTLIGLMLLGMAFVKSGVFTGERSVRFYTAMALGGILGGGLLTAFAFVSIERSSLPIPGMLWQVLAQPVGIPLGLGYAGALLLMVRTGLLAPVRHALSAVGRMALTNYFLQTLICTTLFYGYGLGGLFGVEFAAVEYPTLFAIIAGVWAINITFSLLWQRWFLFGPVEWFWRTLTYWRLQPMRRA